MTKRRVTLPAETESSYSDFVESIEERLTIADDLGDAVQEILVDLNGDREVYDRWVADEEVTAAERVRVLNYHPDHAALESEWYAEKDEASFKRSKALQWLWRQFDRTPLANNVALGLEFRQMLASLLFEDAGDNLRIFRDVTMTYGHNITIGDHSVIHDGVHLDDRGKLTLGDRVSISEDVHLYSHDHDVVDQTEVTNYHTIIEDDARLTYDAMVRGGIKIGENALIGAKSTVQHDIPAHHIVVGSPAKSVRIKPGWESEAQPLDVELTSDRQSRIITRDIPDEAELFDEFQRTLVPPDN